MSLAARIATALVLGSAAIGCQAGADFTEHMNDTSRARLAALDAEAPVVLSCRLATLPGTLPQGMTEVARAGSCVLIQVPRAELTRVRGLPGVSDVTVWGGEAVISRIDSRLRQDLLARLDTGSQEDLNVLATFQSGTAGLRERLEAAGATPRTIAGQIVTLDCPPDRLLDVAALPDLVRLQAPRQLRPNR